MKLNVKKDEHIICCYAEYCNGPGWSNALLWYLVKDVNGKIREECLQPQEQSNDVLTLFPVLAAAHGQMLKALKK